MLIYASRDLVTGKVARVEGEFSSVNGSVLICSQLLDTETIISSA